MSASVYKLRNVVAPVGDSMTAGSQSTPAVQSAGYRWVLEQLAIAAGRRIKFVGTQAAGSFANNWHEGYPGQDIPSIQTSSGAGRGAMQPEGVLLLDGINTLTTATTAGAAAALYTAQLNELYDRSAHALPPGGMPTLQWVICSTVLRYQFDLVAVNLKVVDFNRNFLPGVIAAQRALGRDVVLVDGYSIATSIGADNIHPDDVGYTQLAGAFWTQLQPRLRGAA